MRTLHGWMLILVGLVLVLGCSIPIPTVQPLTTIELVDRVETVGLEGAGSATVRLRLLSQYLRVWAADDVQSVPGAPLLTGQFTYNVEEWAPKIKQETEEGVRSVTISQGIGSQIPLGKGDDYVNRWQVGLARGVPIDLGIDMGSGEAELDLTGLWLTKLSLTSGGTDTVLTLDAPNPEPMSDLRLTAGAGKLIASGLGNANFDQANVLGGAGTLDLDFTGAYQRSALAQVRAGAGRVVLRVPSDIGVRITVSDFSLTQVEASGLTEQDDGTYVNAAYGQSPLTLTIRLTAGVGAISLIAQ